MRSTLPRVVVDLEKLRHLNCGLGRFSLHLGQGLLKDAAEHFEPVFLLPAGAERHFPEGGFERIRVAPWRKEFLRRWIRPLASPVLPRSRVALWHATNQMSKYLPLDPRVPVLLTIHDLNFLHGADGDQRPDRIARKLADIRRRVARATAIATDSEFVARDLAARVDLGDRPVHVVPLGVSTPPPAATRRPDFLPEGSFLFSIGNALPHKNFHVLLDLIEQLPNRRLVIAGKMATPYGGFLHEQVAARGLSARVLLPGEVADDVRQWLYEQCEAFFFPSLAEGFGFPVLEAMQCGKPVFLSPATSLPEVAGGRGFLLESFSGPAMAATYRAGMEAVEADPEFAARARAHATEFSWGATARRYAELYRSLVTVEPARERRSAIAHDRRGAG
jgi:glycosyltransferase involved in cell wall biosynthesis